MLIDVENLRFSSFYYAFFSIAVSSLGVPLYTSRSLSDDFCSKASEPRKAPKFVNLISRYSEYTRNYFSKIKYKYSVVFSQTAGVNLPFGFGFYSSNFTRSKYQVLPMPQPYSNLSQFTSVKDSLSKSKAKVTTTFRQS